MQVYRENEKKTTRVLLVDDQPTVRRGLRMRLTLESDLAVIGEASSGEAAIRLAQALDPDVVLIDVEMPGMDGITATAALHAVAPHVAVVILSLYDDARTRAREREAGAAAFVGKHQAGTMLLATIRRVANSTRSGGTL